MPHITWKCDPMWILFVVEWLVMIIIPFLPFSFCQPKVDFLLLWWNDATVINCVHSLPSMGHSFFTWQLHNASWLHNMDVMLLVCLLYILNIFSIQLWLTFTVFLLKILWSLWWDFGKCLSINWGKMLATFVDTALWVKRNNILSSIFWFLSLIFGVFKINYEPTFLCINTEHS